MKRTGAGERGISQRLCRESQGEAVAEGFLRTRLTFREQSSKFIDGGCRTGGNSKAADREGQDPGGFCTKKANDMGKSPF